MLNSSTTPFRRPRRPQTSQGGPAQDRQGAGEAGGKRYAVTTRVTLSKGAFSAYNTALNNLPRYNADSAEVRLSLALRLAELDIYSGRDERPYRFVFTTYHSEDEIVE